VTGAFDIDPDIARARTLPGRWYGDPRVFARLAERVFAPSWQFAFDARELELPGSVRPWTLLPGLLDEPLVAARGAARELAVFSNVCTHRGHPVAEHAGRFQSLVCRYHGRRFDLGGKFLHAPLFEGAREFPCAADDLPRVACEAWGPLAFVALAPEAGFAEWCGELRARFAWLPLDEFRAVPAQARDYEFEANWALYCDNYLEGFHIPYLHGALNAKIEFGAYRTELQRWSSVQIAVPKAGELAFEIPRGAPDHGQSIAAFYVWLWPNLMLNFYPWGLSLNLVQPLGPTRTRVAFRSFVWKPELVERGAGSALDTVEAEDEAAVEAVQRGVRSRLYTRGRYAPGQETGVHHFHRLLAAALG